MSVDDLITEFERHTPTCLDRNDAIVPIQKFNDPTMYCSMIDYMCDYKKERGCEMICTFYLSQQIYLDIVEK